MQLNFKGVVNNEKLKTWKATVDGIDYICANAIMVGEAVLNGEMLPSDEIKKSTDGWNGILLTVHHPVDEQGNPVCANSPEMIEKYGAGRIFNVRYEEDKKRLRCHIYFDISKKDKSPDHKAAYNAIVKGEPPLEVSTGYFNIDGVPIHGSYQGEEYQGIQSYILPNHFALLPGDIGAFSWEDGGGVRNNSRQKPPKLQTEDGSTVPISKYMWTRIVKLFPSLGKARKSKPKNNAQTDIQEVLNSLLKEKYPDFNWIDAQMHDEESGVTFVVYRKREFDSEGKEIYPVTPKLYRHDYVIDEETGKIRLMGQEKRVKRETSFVAAKRKSRQNARQTQIMTFDLLLSQIKQTHPDVKAINEIYTDSETSEDFAVFEKDKMLYKVPYIIDRKRGTVKLGNTATQVEMGRQYIDKQPPQQEKPAPSKPKKEGKQMPLFKKKAPPAANKTLDMRRAAKNKRVVSNEEGEYNEDYAELYEYLEQYDPDSIVEYLHAYDALELDTIEIAEKVDYDVETSTTEEEAVAYLAEVIEKCYEQIETLQEIAEYCKQKAVEMGYDTSAYDEEEYAQNMDTEDLTDPSYEFEDEDELVKKLGTNKRKSSRRKPKRNSRQPLQKKMSTEQYVNAIPDPELREKIRTYNKKEAAYKKSLIATIVTNSVSKANWKEEHLVNMNLDQLENIVASIGAETPPDYGIRGMQTALKNNSDDGVELQVDAFAKRVKEVK